MHIIIRWGLTLVCLAAAGALAAMTHSPPNLTKALDVQHQLVLENPNDPLIHNDLGNLLVLANRLDEAEQSYRQAVALDAVRPAPHFNLALLYQRQGQAKEALESFRTVVELEPRYAWAHFQIGVLLEREGKKRRAIEAYSRAFTLDPDLANTNVNPQVIDSRLVIEAMLRGYGGSEGRPLAPQAYNDPGRISNLLVDAEELEASLVALEPPPLRSADSTAARDSTVERGRRPAPAWGGSESGDEDLAGSTEEDSLPPGSVATDSVPTRVTSGGAPAGAFGVAGSGATDRQEVDSSRRYRPPSSTTGGTETGGSGASDRSTTPSSTERPGFRPRTTPSTRSTGSLEWRLRPATPQVQPG